MILKARIVVCVERYEASWGVPHALTVFPFNAGCAFMRRYSISGGLAVCFHYFGDVVYRQCDFHQFSAIDDEIVSVAGIWMVQVGGDSGGDFGALSFFHGVQEVNALDLVGVLVADFQFGACVGFQTQENFYGFSDMVADSADGCYVRARRL